ncbi:MAG TPA: hypothetical protein VKB69_02485 [Micromonosporaceae bacterium]|nr:hypothetical protein [Micromonosporaceae bacterium]
MARRSETTSAWAGGGLVVAATIMLMVGFFQAFMGIIGVVRRAFFAHPTSYLYAWNGRGWGWVNIAFGAALVLIALGLYGGATWARVLGIAVVVLAGVNNFLFLPYYPIWSLLLIALDVFIIWALIVGDTRGRAETWVGD